MKWFYVLALIFGIRASFFEDLDLLLSGIRSPINNNLNSEEVAIPNYEKIEDLLTLFQPQNLEISNFSGTLHSDYQIGDIVRLKEYPQLTFLIQEFNGDKSGYVVADEGGLKQYFVNANHLEKCPKSQIDEYKQVRSTNFPIVGKRFRMGGTIYNIISVSLENRELGIEDVISGDSYHYRFGEQDQAILLYKLSVSPAIKKFAQESQDSIDHSPIPTPTSTEPTSREVVSVASNEKSEEEPWKYFERNQLVQNESGKKTYMFRSNSRGKCSVTPLDNFGFLYNVFCNGISAVKNIPEEIDDWNRTGTVIVDLEMAVAPGDTLKKTVKGRRRGKTAEILRSYILVSFSAQEKGRCLLTDESGTSYYVFMCIELIPVNFKSPLE